MVHAQRLRKGVHAPALACSLAREHLSHHSQEEPVGRAMEFAISSPGYGEASVKGTQPGVCTVFFTKAQSSHSLSLAESELEPRSVQILIPMVGVEPGLGAGSVRCRLCSALYHAKEALTLFQGDARRGPSRLLRSLEPFLAPILAAGMLGSLGSSCHREVRAPGDKADREQSPDHKVKE